MIIKSRGLRDLTVKYIERQISNGNIPIGSYLPSERDFSELIGVTRTTLREALSILECKGVVAGWHGKKWLVLKSIDECEEHY